MQSAYMPRLSKVEYLLHVRIELTVRPDAEFFEARMGEGPPALGNFVPGYFFHIRFIVIAYILKVGKHGFALPKNGIIAQITVMYRLQNLGPGIRVKRLVLLDFFFLQTSNLSKNYFFLLTHNILSNKRLVTTKAPVLPQMSICKA